MYVWNVAWLFLAKFRGSFIILFFFYFVNIIAGSFDETKLYPIYCRGDEVGLIAHMVETCSVFTV